MYTLDSAKLDTFVHGQHYLRHDATKLRVVVAGGRIGGLCAALVMKNTASRIMTRHDAQIQLHLLESMH